MKKKIPKIHLSNFTAKIISMIRTISISLKKLYSYKWQNKAFLFLCYKLKLINISFTIRQKHTIQTRSKKTPAIHAAENVIAGVSLYSDFMKLKPAAFPFSNGAEGIQYSSGP